MNLPAAALTILVAASAASAKVAVPPDVDLLAARLLDILGRCRRSGRSKLKPLSNEPCSTCKRYTFLRLRFWHATTVQSGDGGDVGVSEDCARDVAAFTEFYHDRRFNQTYLSDPEHYWWYKSTYTETTSSRSL